MQIVRVADRYDPHATSRRQRVPWRRRRAAVAADVEARRRDELPQPRSERLPAAETVRMPAQRVVGSSAQRVSFDTSQYRLLGALRQQCQEARQEWQRRQCDGCSCGRGAYGCSPAAGSPACASKAQHGDVVASIGVRCSAFRPKCLQLLGAEEKAGKGNRKTGAFSSFTDRCAA